MKICISVCIIIIQAVDSFMLLLYAIYTLFTKNWFIYEVLGMYVGVLY